MELKEALEDVDHLVAAKEAIHDAETGGSAFDVQCAQAHATIALADSLRQMIGTYPNGETYVNVRVSGSVDTK